MNTGAPVDGYDPAAHYAQVDIGQVTYSGGPATKLYRFVATGRNGSIRAFRIDVDSISLLEIASGGTATAEELIFGGGEGQATRRVMTGHAGGSTPAPVSLPPSAGLLLGGLCLLGLTGKLRHVAGSAKRQRAA